MSRSPADLKAQIEAERAGAPFLVWREDAQRILTLEDGRLTIGRDAGCDIALADDEVSRLHAELERVGAHWVLADHGLSTNGTFLNGERRARREGAARRRHHPRRRPRSCCTARPPSSRRRARGPPPTLRRR